MKIRLLFATVLLLPIFAACGSTTVESETDAVAESLSAGAAVATEANPEAAAAYCSGSGCNGKNPQGTNCQNGAYRVFPAYPIGPSAEWGSIELWYSPACNANWARSINGLFGKPSVWLQQNGSKYPSSGKPLQCSGNVCWSAMRNGTPLTAACGQINVYADVCSPYG